MAAGWRIRVATDSDAAAVETFLDAHEATLVARQGTLEDARQAPALVADAGGAVIGLLTYLVDGTDCEVLTIHAERQWSGIGTALLDAIERVAAWEGCERLWLVSTNDNVDALRFYQRRGFRLVRVDAGAVDLARALLKRSIPTVGLHGIPMHDELVLERSVVGR